MSAELYLCLSGDLVRLNICKLAQSLWRFSKQVAILLRTLRLGICHAPMLYEGEAASFKLGSEVESFWQPGPCARTVGAKAEQVSSVAWGFECSVFPFSVAVVSLLLLICLLEGKVRWCGVCGS